VYVPVLFEIVHCEKYRTLRENLRSVLVGLAFF
jgi:hypothetical protein